LAPLQPLPREKGIKIKTRYEKEQKKDERQQNEHAYLKDPCYIIRVELRGLAKQVLHERPDLVELLPVAIFRYCAIHRLSYNFRPIEPGAPPSGKTASIGMA
jgi:hypothetical protein